jgi:F-type H+-transporting ATPase subunit b
MPQINQLADVLYSQLFWLALTLAVIYFGIGRAMLPKIQSTVAARDSRIAEDLAGAEAARRAADATEDAYRARMEASRGEALKVTAGARQESARATESRVREADTATRARLEEAEARLRTAADAAMAEIEAVAAEAAQEMAARLAGVSVPREEAARAVRTVMVHG